ncbi:MAG: polysaccharide deacetylase family protein [Candidatus Marinimicrobia bacterium]|nr:polysaccharide deacetylase family protein [Candidatus Neomarinimicrobiota bacterium]
MESYFFILGWIAEKYPEVVKQIQSEGQEIACHSYYHDLVHRMDKEVFFNDTDRSLKTIEDIIGNKIIIYRAPAFYYRETPWAC